jgi:hypothetical protein
MKQTDLAWAAGLFDGEGHIRLSWYNGAVDAALVLAMVDKPSVCKFFSIVNLGSFIIRPPQKNGWKTQWKWQARSQEANKVAKLLSPYLICKKKKMLSFISVLDRAKIRYNLSRGSTGIPKNERELVNKSIKIIKEKKEWK